MGAASATDSYVGSPDDLRNGFMHFSTKAQVHTGVTLRRAEQVRLVLLTVATEALECNLKWEPSRGGQFPSLLRQVSKKYRGENYRNSTWF